MSSNSPQAIRRCAGPACSVACEVVRWMRLPAGSWPFFVMWLGRPLSPSAQRLFRAGAQQCQPSSGRQRDSPLRAKHTARARPVIDTRRSLAAQPNRSRPGGNALARVALSCGRSRFLHTTPFGGQSRAACCTEQNCRLPRPLVPSLSVLYQATLAVKNTSPSDLEPLFQ